MSWNISGSRSSQRVLKKRSSHDKRRRASCTVWSFKDSGWMLVSLLTSSQVKIISDWNRWVLIYEDFLALGMCLYLTSLGLKNSPLLSKGPCLVGNVIVDPTAKIGPNCVIGDWAFEGSYIYNILPRSKCYNWTRRCDR